MTNPFRHRIMLPHQNRATGKFADLLFGWIISQISSRLSSHISSQLANLFANWLGIWGRHSWTGSSKLVCASAFFIFCLVLPLNSFAKLSYAAEEEFGDSGANSTQHPEKAVKHVLSFASLGKNHSLVLDGDSTLWVFGDNNFGQLGLAGQAAVVTPLALLRNVKNVMAGPNHSFAITQDGTLWAFGENSYGQLGNGSVRDVSSSFDNSNPEGARLSGTFAGSPTGSPSGFSAGSVAGESSGGSSNGVAVSNLSPVLSRVLAVSTSAKHTLALDEIGNVWSFGDNSQGQLGTGNKLSSPSPLKVMSGASAVVAGKDFSLALAREYTLWAWGGNLFGQLGTGSTKNVLHPSPVLSQVMKVSPGNFHVLALRNDDSLWAWGGNKFGQVGDGSNEMRMAPVKIMDNVADVAAGPDYSLALGLDGRLWIWGRVGFALQTGQLLGQASGQASGQALGQISGDTSPETSPKKPVQPFVQKLLTRPTLILEDIAQITVAEQCCLALGKDGKLWFFGCLEAPEYSEEAHVQLPAYSPFSLSSPRLLAENVEMAVPGAQHLLFIKQNGSLWGMGNNFSGQTGHKNLELILEPQKVKFKFN